MSLTFKRCSEYVVYANGVMFEVMPIEDFVCLSNNCLKNGIWCF